MRSFSNPVPGLQYVPNFVAPIEESEFVKRIEENASSWLTDFKRRVQHYGYVYSYRWERAPAYIGPLPDWLHSLAIRLLEAGLMRRVADQVIVNEYLPGQNISEHVDRDCFGPEIATLSLNSTCIMRFKNKSTAKKEEIFLEPRSLLILAGEARTNWTHEIPKRKSDYWAGRMYRRDRRLSVTLRTVLNGQ